MGDEARKAAAFAELDDGPFVASLGPLRPDRIKLKSGHEIACVSFYCPGTGLTECDKRTGGAPFANFWPLAPSTITLTHNGASGTFANSEAAYQSFKWWQNAETRKRFEACDAAGLQGGEDAFTLKRAVEKDVRHVITSAASDARGESGGLGKWAAMLLVLRAKWRLPGFRELLLGSAGMLLVEHSAKAGRDPFWTDDHTGGGQNRLGAALMLVRDELLAEDGQPSGWPQHVPRPAWAAAGASSVSPTDVTDSSASPADVDTAAWQSVVDEVAVFLLALEFVKTAA